MLVGHVLLLAIRKPDVIIIVIVMHRVIQGIHFPFGSLQLFAYRRY